MRPGDFKTSSAGRLVQIPEGGWAFIPNPLPPKLHYDPELILLLSEADRGLGELRGAAGRLPNPHLLVFPYLNREAVLSSRIEGTQASISDVLELEASEEERNHGGRRPDSDVREVANYITALEYGIRRLDDLPLSLRLAREIHERLLSGVRGEEKRPGVFRNRINWIGPPGCRS